MNFRTLLQDNNVKIITILKKKKRDYIEYGKVSHANKTMDIY